MTSVTQAQAHCLNEGPHSKCSLKTVLKQQVIAIPGRSGQPACARHMEQKLHAGGQKCLLGTESACWGHKLRAGYTNCLLRTKRHAGNSFECDRSSSWQGTISAHLSGSRMKIAPPGPGLAQLLCLIFINSQNAASFEASLQQQHTVAPQALKALSGHTPARLFRMHTCLSNTISHIKRAQNLVLPQRQIFHAVSSVLKRA